MSMQRPRSHFAPATALGGIALLLWAAPAAAQNAPDLITTSHPRVDVDYATSVAPQDLDSVELWTTDDGGRTWQFAGYDADRRSPISFTAPHEGEFGFYVILANAAGASGPRPEPGTLPQHRVMIDYSGPVLQLHQADVLEAGPGDRRVILSWSAYDANFFDRPIALSYRIGEEPQWTEIDRRVANIGRYEWLPPAELSGAVEIRVLARDAAHHLTIRQYPPIHLSAVPVAPQAKPEIDHSDSQAPPQAPQPEYRLASMTPRAANDVDSDAATARINRGVWNLRRGRLEVAEERFREALEVSPHHRDARLHLAGVLKRKRKYAAAQREYEALLRDDPRDADALRGLSLALAGEHRYPEAVAALRRIADDNAMDARTLIELGDLYYLSGNTPLAIREWRRAERKPDLTSDQVRAVRTRLDMQTATP